MTLLQFLIRFLFISCYGTSVQGSACSGVGCSARTSSPMLLQKAAPQVFKSAVAEEEEEEEEEDDDASQRADEELTCEKLCEMKNMGSKAGDCTVAKTEKECLAGYYKKAGVAVVCKWKSSGRCTGGKEKLKDCPSCSGRDESKPISRDEIPNSNRTGANRCKTEPVTINFDTYRFRTLSIRDPTAGTVKLAEIEVADGDGNILDIQQLGNEGKSRKGEDAAKAGDGKTRTFWGDRLMLPLILRMAKRVKAAKFRFVTAPGSPGSDPVRWVFEANMSGGAWIALHNQDEAYEGTRGTSDWFMLEGSAIGQECFYECDDGFVKWGRQVFQEYKAQDTEFIHEAFSGGSCEPLCPNQPDAGKCPYPARYHSEDDAYKFCLATTCFESKDDLLKELLRGNYELWRHARNPKSGLYLDSLQVLKPDSKYWSYGNTGMVGIGIIIECIAHAMNFTDVQTAQRSVLRTLKSLVGQTAGVKAPKRKHLGLFSGLVNTDTGEVGGGPGQIGNNGFLMSGVLFQKKYWNQIAPQEKQTQEITELADQLFNSIDWAGILCNANNQLDPNGDGFPFIVQESGLCENVHRPNKVGLRHVDELYVAAWLMYEHTCGSSPAGECANKAVEKLWQGFQGRRDKPGNLELFGKHILIDWGSYPLQLNFYLAGAFNSDPKWRKLFSNQHEVESMLYRTSLYYGDALHEGLAAGPTLKGCAGLGYIADRLWDPSKRQDKSPNCRTWSPYAVAGYMPADRDAASDALVGMMRTGEAVTAFQAVDGTQRFILNRRSLLFPHYEPQQTMVDISEEAFGLAHYFLGQSWWERNTDYFNALHPSAIQRHRSSGKSAGRGLRDDKSVFVDAV